MCIQHIQTRKVEHFHSNFNFKLLSVCLSVFLSVCLSVKLSDSQTDRQTDRPYGQYGVLKGGFVVICLNKPKCHIFFESQHTC